MTRDEAIKIVSEVRDDSAVDDWCSIFVDRCAALGMLKLDEPKSIDERLAAAIWVHPNLAHAAPAYVKEAIEAAGLKIVEK